ncbi:MAG: hypothetical protein CMO80_03580 [Verrucomicrobiales bacterium]|nr:hypothetical protein [Verrucomicrobiales bacterium]|tara:strand:+ start:450 stop:1235 length:786 start_codon:yes stop_codon:yes gene_type:complete
MKWFYAIGDEKKGPVDEAGFQELIDEGVVKEQTLVWHKGLPDWLPYSEAKNFSVPKPAPIVPAIPTKESCTTCGKPLDPSALVSLDGRRICPSCHQAEFHGVQDGSIDMEAMETIRREHLSREVSLKSLGWVLIAFGIFFALGVLDNLGKGQTGGAIALTLLSAGSIYSGMRLRWLDRRAMIPIGIMCGIFALGVPVGTIIAAWIAYMVFSKKSRFVLSKECAGIRVITPHVKYETGPIYKVAMVLVILFGTGLLLAALSG